MSPTRATKRLKLSRGSGVVATASTPATSTAAPAAPAAAAGLDDLLGVHPLRLVIVGHNPSEIAWREGHYYANPSNWMWRILAETGIAPSQVTGPKDDHLMPSLAGVGFTDVGGGHPGTQSSHFTSKDFALWRQPFFDRLAAHARAAGERIGCTCGACGSPIIVAFSGKRQFAELFQGGKGGTRPAQKGGKGGVAVNTCNKEGTVDQGPQASTAPRVQSSRPSFIPLGRQAVLPACWPLPFSEVWVLTSTSGASPLTREQRFGSWRQLAARLEEEPWPRRLRATCEAEA
jgi:thymine-DNA glycosylase